MRVPFGGNSFNHDNFAWHGNTDCECLNSTDCFVNNLAGNVFQTNMMAQDNVIRLTYDDIMAAVERTKKYIRR